MNLTIRYTQKSDLSALLDIYNYEVVNGTATFDLNPKSLADWEKWLEEHSVGNHFALTALVDDTPVGYATLSGYREKEAYIQTTELSVYVHPDYRGRGIATQLINETVAIARARGDVHTIVSVITGSNEASLKMHEKLGFTYGGTLYQVGEKFGKLMDIVNYQLILK